MELLTEKNITYPCKHNKLLKDIKTGKISFEEFINLKNQLEEMCYMIENENKLPTKPNFDIINNYCIKTLINNLR